MGGAKKSTWIGGTAFAAVVIALGAWFLVVSPKLADASELRSEAEQVRSANEVLSMQVTKLAADFKKLPEYKAQLEELRTQIPVDAMLADYVRQLDTIAVAHEVTLISITPSAPQALALPVGPAAQAPADETSTSEEPAGDPAPAPTSTAKAPGLPGGFTAIPFSITAVGTYDNALAFLSDLQNSTTRLFLVTGWTGTSQEDNDAGGGRPATKVGDVELIVTGQTYVLPDSLAVPAAVDPAAPPAALPGAVAGKNPLVPIDGR